MKLSEAVEMSQLSRIALRSPITLDELYALMAERWDTARFGGFKLKKFLMMRSIELDDYLLLRFDVQITGMVVLGHKEQSTKSNIVHIVAIDAPWPNPNKEQQARIKELGGYNEAREPSLERYRALCAAMREVLRDRI